MAVQPATITCLFCHRVVTVIATASRYEFEWRCACGMAGTISWAHANPPPRFTP